MAWFGKLNAFKERGPGPFQPPFLVGFPDEPKPAFISSIRNTTLKMAECRTSHHSLLAKVKLL